MNFIFQYKILIKLTTKLIEQKVKNMAKKFMLLYINKQHKSNFKYNFKKIVENFKKVLQNLKNVV